MLAAAALALLALRALAARGAPGADSAQQVVTCAERAGGRRESQRALPCSVA
jgi:hypothetical protein